MRSSMLIVLLLLAIMALGITQDLGQADRGRVHGGVMMKWGNIQSPTEVSTASNAKEYRPSVRRVILPGVRRLVPGEYPTIQAAIDASVDGDTVLISEGTYFENIRYKGKAIVVASHYLMDGDTTHIPLTIIDGSNPSNPDSGSVVYFIDGEDTTSVLCGLTIRGGSGTNWYLDRWYREGGGIFCLSSGARIVRNFITRNRIDGTTGDGGGVWAVNMTSSLPYLILEQNRITANFVRGSLINETMWVCGGGAAVWSTSARIIGNLFESDTAAATYGAGPGGLAFQGFPDGPYPTGIIQGNIFRGNVVTTMQRGAFGGGMVVEHTGQVCIIDNLFEGNIAISPEHSRGGGLWIGDRYLPGTIAPVRKFILRNRFLDNSTICTVVGTGWGTGGGIELDATVATIAQNQISGNNATGTLYGGGGIWVFASSCRIENNIIAQNHAIYYGGGVQINSHPMPLCGTEQVIANNTIFDNGATRGGGLSINNGANVVSFNNIFWADSAQNENEIYVGVGTINVRYCDVQGGYTGEGNINADPQFALPMLDSLNNSSPCIGAGRDNILVTGLPYYAPTTDIHGHPRPQPASSMPDIGAAENPRPFPDRLTLREVPAEYPTIQAAIDACVDGDTVIISEGTYYENIRYKGKAIVVASHYLIDDDTTHIPLTIINGSNPANPDSGSVVYFIDGEDTTSVLYGLTIQGGTGTNWVFEGISYRYGGGIILESAGGRLTRNIISHNRVIGESAFAGGISALYLTNDIPYVILEGNQVTDNFVQSVSSVSENYGESGGADLTGVSSRIVGNVFARDTLMAANFAGGGGLGVFPTLAGSLVYSLIKDNIFLDNIIIANDDVAGGGGLFIYGNVQANIMQNLFKNNIATSIHSSAWGGGIYIYNSYFQLENNIITGNYSYHYGGGIAIEGYSEEQVIVNNTISENEAVYAGGGLEIFGGASVMVLNNILWANTSPIQPEIYVTGDGTAYVRYCDVQGGYTGEGNISKEPMLRGENFILSDSSSCIGAGIAEYTFGSTIISCPPTDYLGNPRPNPAGFPPDMGACESPLPSPVVGLRTPFANNLPVSFDLKQNYPNPFNPVTAISFDLPNASQVTLKIYNILGEEVATLVSGQLLAGSYQYEWDASGVASGVYLYRLEVPSQSSGQGFVQTRKMVLMR